MIVNSHLFEAFLECSTKCWLRSRAVPTAGNIYAEWARAQNEAYCEGGLKRLLAIFPESDRAIAPPISQYAKEVTWRIASDVRVRMNNLDSHLQAVERLPSAGRGRSVQFIPYRFQFTNKLTKNHKLSLAFDALVLSEAAGQEISLGKITHGDGHATLKVKLSSLVREVQKRIRAVTALLADNSPPDLILNRHCSQCEFRARCHKQATEKDELSLLSGISEKERKKLHGKGIFTVTQLSYTFRPRRRRRRLPSKQERFHHSLRALAIRENKIHAVDVLDPKLDGTPVYLDVEGLPDRDFYYLIGVRVGTSDGAVEHSFWADDVDGEKSGSRSNPCRARCHGTVFGRAQGRSTGRTSQQEQKGSRVPQAIASRSGPSGSAKPHNPEPPCLRQSSASPDHAADVRRRSRPRIQRGDQIPIAGTTRPMRAGHSCQCVCRQKHHSPSRSSRWRHRVRDRRAARHRTSPRSRKTGASGGGQNQAEEHPIPIHPLRSPSQPRAIHDKLLIAISESPKRRRNSVHYLVNAG